ncbi:MAG: GNAT family N-acetyltransferase [Ruminococcaceae bacterium]|nr:GNAT family N-acetyltransferase [Oscillospiraceae bacterium]
MKTHITISRDEYDLLSLGFSATAEISILNDQAHIVLPEAFGEVSESIICGLLTCVDTESAFSLFKKLLIEKAQTLGCKTQQESRKYRFVCTSDTNLNETAILPESENISDDLAKLGLKRKMWGDDDYPYSGFGVKEQGELISWCVENSHYLADSETEIGVRTEEAYRRKGYALSNTVFLCRKLLRRGMTKIFYECDIENHASFHLAQKAGLEKTGEVLYMIFKQ